MFCLWILWRHGRNVHAFKAAGATALALASFLVLPAPAASGSDAATGGETPDKSGYTLLNPTPRSLLRELSTDRPDKTEGPYTVDAGHFQLEMDLVSYVRDRDKSGGGDTRTETWAVAPVNLKLGLFHDVDLQLAIDTYTNLRTEDLVAGTTDRRSGFGDMTLRLKKNFWGNDGGKTSFAMMPFLKFPTNQHDLGNHAVEGGVIFPLALKLPAGWDMGLMTEVDFLRNETDKGYHASSINSITFGHDIVGNLGGYLEFFSEVSAEDGLPWVGTVDTGLTYGITDNMQLDAGINIGVTEAADDLNLFLGFSWRY